MFFASIEDLFVVDNNTFWTLLQDERVARWREERGEKWLEAQRKIRVAVSSQLPSSAMDVRSGVMRTFKHCIYMLLLMMHDVHLQGILRRSEKDLDVVDRGLTADLARMAERCQR